MFMKLEDQNCHQLRNIEFGFDFSKIVQESIIKILKYFSNSAKICP